MARPSGQCSNFGNCLIADARKTVEVPSGQDLVRPECGRALILTSQARTQSAPAFVVLGVVTIVVLLFGAGVYYLWHLLAADDTRAGQPSQPPTASKPLPPDPQPQAAAQPRALDPAHVLRFAGSNTLGSELLPALAEAYLTREGASAVRREALASPVETRVVGEFANGARAFEIRAHGTSTAFEALRSGSADIAMASRRISAPESESLKALGDMTAASREHVLAIDGVAIIVHADNQLAGVDVGKLGSIFSGELADFAQVGGPHGSIQLFARDNASGTYDTVKTLVLRDKALGPKAQRFEDGAALVAAVASHPFGIGFVSMSQANAGQGVRTLAISERGTSPLLPTRMTVATEDYPLARRLYLYLGNSSHEHARRFIEFALGKAGQELVANRGFVALTVSGEATSPQAGASANYRKLIEGATRLTTNFRFRTGSSELDNRALRDLERVAEFMTDLQFSGDKLSLFGFADSTGSAGANDKLSQDRAEAVAAALRQRGLQPGTVRGLGQTLPVADNTTAEGREKNRRVEVWVRKR